MKLLLILLSFNLFAEPGTYSCQDLLDDGNGRVAIYNLGRIDSLTRPIQNQVSFNATQMNSELLISQIGEFDAVRCERAMISEDYVMINGAQLSFVYTNEDRCDGGNSYGYLADAQNEVIGIIADGELYCL